MNVNLKSIVGSRIRVDAVDGILVTKCFLKLLVETKNCDTLNVIWDITDAQLGFFTRRVARVSRWLARG